MMWTTILSAAIGGALGGLTYIIISDRVHERRCQQEEEERVRWYYKCDWCGAGFGCYPQDWDACMAQHEATCARQDP